MSFRKFETDYAGAWHGFCKTRESAIVAAIKRIVNDGYAKATVTDRETGEVVARLNMDYNRKGVQIETSKQLRRIGK